MTTWYISRNVGARKWVRKQGVSIDRCLDHLNPEKFSPGDTAIAKQANRRKKFMKEV